MYLKEIGCVDLLFVEEEIWFVMCIEEGDEEVKCRFVEVNLCFVVSIVKCYVGCGMFFLDLI